MIERTLQRVLDDGDNALKLLRGEVTGTLAQINIGLLADQVGVAATDTLDLGQGVHDLLLAIDVCVQQTDDVLEAVASQHCCSLTHYSQGVHRRAPRRHMPTESATPMQAPLPFPDSMLILHHCVLYSLPTTTGVVILLFQHAVADRGKALLRVAGSERRIGHGEEVRRKHRWRAQGKVLLGTYLDFSPETSAMQILACLFDVFCLRSAILRSHPPSQPSESELRRKAGSRCCIAQGMAGRYSHMMAACRGLLVSRSSVLSSNSFSDRGCVRSERR